MVGSYANTAQWLEGVDAPDQDTVLQAFEIGSDSGSGDRLYTKATILAYQTTAEQS